jgi:hypothetical protein
LMTRLPHEAILTAAVVTCGGQDKGVVESGAENQNEQYDPNKKSIRSFRGAKAPRVVAESSTWRWLSLWEYIYNRRSRGHLSIQNVPPPLQPQVVLVRHVKAYTLCFSCASRPWWTFCPSVVDRQQRLVDCRAVLTKPALGLLVNKCSWLREEGKGGSRKRIH